MQKNTAGKWTVFAYGLPSHASPGEPVTGDAANITANMRIDGAAANAVDDTNPTEMEDGFYIFDITAAEANGDMLLLSPQSSTANVQVIGVPGAVWTRDDLNAAIAVIDTNVDQIETAVITNAAGTDIAADIIALKAETVLIVADTGELQTDWANGGRLDLIIDAILDDTANALPATLTNVLVDTGTNLPALIAALNDLSAAQVNAEVDSGLNDFFTSSAQLVDDIWDELAADHMTLLTMGRILNNAEVDSAAAYTRVSINIPNQLITIDGIVDSILVDTSTDIPARFDGVEGATFSTSTDSLEALRNRGDAAWTTGAGGTPPHLLQSTTIATLASQTSFTLTAGSADDDAYNNAIAVVTDSVTAEQKAVGSVSDYVGSTKTITLAADPAIFTMAIGDTIEIMSALGSAGSAPTAVQVRQEMDSNSTQLAAIVADTNELQGDDVPGLISGLNDPTVAAIVGGVWGELQAGYVTAGTFGLYLDAAVSGVGGGTPLTSQETRDAMKLAPTGGAPGAGSIDEHLDDILADSNELQGDWVNGGRLDLILDATATGTAVASVQSDTDDIQTRIPASLVGGLMRSDTLAISQSTTAADNLQASTEAIISSTATGSPTTTTMPDSSLTEATDDHYVGRVIIWKSGAADGIAANVTGYNGTTKTFTFDAVVTASSSGDAYILV